jgi:hypothetical protein
VTGEVLARRDVAEDLGDAVLEKPLKRLGLNLDEVRELLDLTQLSERNPLTRKTSQRHSIPGSTGNTITANSRSGAEENKS